MKELSSQGTASLETKEQKMNGSMTDGSVSLRALRWSARVWSILAVGLVLLFAFGEGMNLSHFTAHELVLFVFFPLGVCLGMAVAWWREGLGGGVTVASFAAFYLAHFLQSSHLPRGLAFAAVAAPGFLFLLSWLLARSAARQSGV
jgi:hypothetical protein